MKIKSHLHFFIGFRIETTYPYAYQFLKLNDYDIKKSSSIKFLGVLVDEHLSWPDHINILENKLSKNLGLLYKSKHFLNAIGMKSLYYSFFIAI